MRIGKPDSSLTSVAGLVLLATFLHAIGIDKQLRELFHGLKSGKGVIYPMHAQLRLLLDLFVAGEQRVFGLENLAEDNLFVWLAGGVVPSLDTVYRDLDRFDDKALSDLTDMMTEQGLVAVKKIRRPTQIHLDVDTTVTPVFGDLEGAAVGYNPQYHGRLSFHPIVARVAETDTCVGAMLRPGDTGFGSAEVPFLQDTIDRVRNAVGDDCLIHVRIDSAGDCAQVMRASHDKGALFVTKARMTQDLCGMVSMHPQWHTVDHDADGKPSRQVALIEFRRKEWGSSDEFPVRVIAVRTRERDSGKQLYLWDGLDMTVQVYLTNDLWSEPDDVAWRYDKRAGIEPLIAEWKNAWGIGKMAANGFTANSAVFILKLLAHNLLRRYVEQYVPELRSWRTPWIRRAIILVPGRVTRSGRRRMLRMPHRLALQPMLE